MEINASTLAVYTYIDAVLANSACRSLAEERLADVDLDTAWLQDLSGRYKAAHQSDITSTTFDETVLLLSWMFSDIRQPAQVVELNANAWEAMNEISLRLRGVYVNRSMQLRLELGVLGRVASDRVEYPVIFSTNGLIDEDIEHAYEGLIHHVMAPTDKTTYEMYRTAILWRLGGIAQGLVGGSDELFDCMKRLTQSFQGSLTIDVQRKFQSDEWLKEFRDRRNLATHVRGGGFRELSNSLLEDESILNLYLRLTTFYVASAINTRLRELDPDRVRQWLNKVETDYDWISDNVYF